MCKLPVDDQKEDCAQLNGSCSHLLHLRCWREKGCCSRPKGTVDMESDLMDPLRIMGDMKEEPAEMKTPMNPFRRLFSSLSNSLDAAVDTNGTTLARRKTPVKELIANGYNAVTLVQEEPNIVPILIQEGQYTSLQLKQLGFHWELLIQGGLSENTFQVIYPILGKDFIDTFVVDLSSLLILCSKDITQIPRLMITSSDLGLKIKAADLFEAKMEPRTMVAFGFTIEQWVKDLCLQESNLSTWSNDSLRELIRHNPEEKVAFDHFFSETTVTLEAEPIEIPQTSPEHRTRPLINPQPLHHPTWRRPTQGKHKGKGPIAMSQIRQ